MFSFTNGLRGVGRGTRSRSDNQGAEQRGDNQSLESWQMGDAPRDLSGSRGTTGLGDPGRYSFGEDAGQQGTGPGVGFALPEYGSNLDAAPPPSASGAMASGGPGQWALPTMGTGIIGAPGAPTFGGPGQWASPTTGTGISGVSFAQPGTGSQGGNASGSTSTGGPGQGASPTTGSGNTGLVGTVVMPAGMASLPAGMGPGGMGGQGPAGQPSLVGPMGPSGEYSGIGSCLDKLGDALQGPELLIRPVRWQRTVAGDSGKISAFTAEVGSLLTFQAFLMMREGSAMVTTVHSIAKYFSLSAATSRYQGKYIGFVGDRLAAREPGPVLLQPTKSWAWVKKSVQSNGEEVIQAYTGGLEHGLLWAPTPNGTEVEMHVPRLLCLPPVFVKLLRDQKKALMPHEVWQVVKTFSKSQGLPQECVDACTFIMDWCVVASQATALEKDSFLAFGLDSVTEQDSDVSLAVWLKSRLDTT